MKKVISLALALMMLFLFVSCGKGEEQSIPSMIKAAYKGLESETWIRSIPRAKKFTASGEHADYDTKYRIGISAESMDKYIEEAYYSCPDIQPNTYELTMVKIKEGVSAEPLMHEMVKGADLYKWICMGADQAAGAYFGDYIVMVLGSTEQIDAVFASFKKLHPDMSEIFYRIEREK
ncbi:MAG TPA: hypothetical protein DD628_02935 [Clostridiales bacterium]|nr:hypothetical protein [Candidatus Apopatosoma intestinale]